MNAPSLWNIKTPSIQKQQSPSACASACTSQTERSLLDDVIRPFSLCTKHNFAWRERSSDISLSGLLLYRFPQSIASLLHLSFPNWAPYCAVVSSCSLYNPHQQHKITTKIFRARNVFLHLLFFNFNKMGKQNPHSRTRSTGVTAVCVWVCSMCVCVPEGVDACLRLFVLIWTCWCVQWRSCVFLDAKFSPRVWDTGRQKKGGALLGVLQALYQLLVWTFGEQWGDMDNVCQVPQHRPPHKKRIKKK